MRVEAKEGTGEKKAAQAKETRFGLEGVEGVEQQGWGNNGRARNVTGMGWTRFISSKGNLLGASQPAPPTSTRARSTADAGLEASSDDGGSTGLSVWCPFEGWPTRAVAWM